MSTKINELLTREIDELVAIAERLSLEAARSDDTLGSERVTELSLVAARSGQLIRRLYESGSHYEGMLKNVLAVPSFSTMHSNYYQHVSELVGILKGIQHEIKSGLLTDLRRLLQQRFLLISSRWPNTYSRKDTKMHRQFFWEAC